MKKVLLPLFSLLIVSFVFMVVFSFSNRYIRVVRAREKLIEISRKIEKLKRENKELAIKVRLLNEPFYIEKVARERLGLVKPGETLFLPRIH